MQQLTNPNLSIVYNYMYMYIHDTNLPILYYSCSIHNIIFIASLNETYFHMRPHE